MRLSALKRVVGRAARREVGGEARRRAVFLLASVLALNTADIATIGAMGGQLESALRLSNTELGLLASLPAVIGALASLPFGVLTDRVHRVHLLALSVVVWSLATAASAAAQSFVMLLLIRMGLGAALATAGPTLSSLVGDFFPSRERGRIWGWILTGELIGAGFGFIISGEVASAGSWRLAFLVMALPCLALGIMLWRGLPEPARGGQSVLTHDAEEFIPAEEVAQGATLTDPVPEAQDAADRDDDAAQRLVAERDVAPDDTLVLRCDPARMTFWQATRYVLRIPTNVVLIIASSLGYFYFQGVQTFGVVFISGRYGVSHSVATLLVAGIGIGAFAGVLAGGRTTDRMLESGKVNARIVVGGLGFVLASVLFTAGLLSHVLVVSLVLFVLAGAAFGARNPPLDAARLDIMHHRLWGRAEAVRTLLRQTVTATAPFLFGLLADQLASGSSAAHGQYGFGANANARGLHLAFLIMVITLAAGGLLTFRAMRTYARDVATARRSEELATAGSEEARACG